MRSIVDLFLLLVTHIVEILINLSSDLIWAIIGALLLRLYFEISQRLPVKRLWNFSNPKKLIICTANSADTQTGDYLRPATGIGQVRALAPIIKSLSGTYGKLELDEIYFSTDMIGEKIENDLIILGGVKKNRITSEFLSLLKDNQPAYQIGSTVYWKETRENMTLNKNTERFEGKTDKKEVLTDYGLIIRSQNPFCNKPSMAILFAGSHTYGTIAAAKYFTTSLRKMINILNYQNNFSILVQCKVVDRFPTEIQMIKCYQWR